MDDNNTVTTLIASVDTSSIIENKKSTKEYWEKRMMAEMGDSTVDQLLIDTELVKMASTANGNKCIKRLISSNPNSPKGSSSAQQSSVTGPTSPSIMMNLTSQGSTEKQSNGQYHGISSSKLGSDGESEASPECSLSPVEVDSLEGGSSRDSSTCDRRSSPDYVNCTHGVDDEEDDGVVADDDGFRECDSSPDAGISGCRPVDYESNSLSPEMIMTSSSNSKLNSSKGSNINHRRTPSSSSSSSPSLPLSPVIGQNPKSSTCSPVSSSSLPSPPSLSSSPLPQSNETVLSCTKVKPLNSSSSRENGQQSDNGNTVTEPDSLEEFIKHETECSQSNIDPNCDNSIKSQPDDCPSQLIIDSLEDSGLCQDSSTLSSDAFDQQLLPSLPKSSNDDQLIENVTSPSLSSISGYNKLDSGVNQTDDLLLIVDCPNDSKGNNLMTNLDSSSLPSVQLSPSLPSHNIVSNNNQSKCFPTHFYVNNADNNNDDDEHVDDDSVDNVTQNDNHDVHNHQKNDIEITSSIEGSALAKGINCGDGIDRPTIIGQLAKPSDNETNGSMLINEENIIECKSSTTSPRDSKLSLVNDQPVSMLVNYDESERFEYQSSPCDEANNLLLIKSNQPLNCSIETSSKSSSPAASPATCLRPLAGIVGKQTGKIVRRESSGIIKSSAESMIAEEIRQLKEREEELARMRQAMSKQQSEGHQQLKGGSTMSPLSVSSSSLHHLSNSSSHHHPHQPGHHSVNSQIHHQLGKSTPSHCSSIDGKSSPALSDLSSCSVGTISNDSIDPVPSKPISLEILSSKVSGLLSESPIEREIRISREREAELKAQVNLTRTLSNSIVNNDNQHLPTIQSTSTVNHQSKPIIVKEAHTNGNVGPINGEPVAPSNGPLNKSLSMDETIVTSAGTKLPVFKQNSCGAANAADIQKLLATTRIQQEIEEQTQRELALKATGSIKTISQERTDIEKAGSTYSSINQINAASKASTTTLTSKPEELQTAKAIETPSLSGHNGLSGNVSNSIGSSFSSSLVNQSNQVNQINNINTENNSNYNISIIQSNKPTPPLPPPAPSSLSSVSSSSSSSSSGATITSIRRTGFQPFMKKGLTKSISMHKFISSKGKTATPTGNPTSSAFYPLASPGDLYNGDLRPPIMVKGDKGFRRGSVSAESKIQEELKEMKAREEELRRQRARLMGLSQPNLALIGRDADDEGDEDNGNIDGNGGDENAGQIVGLNGSLYEIDAGLKRTTSNPNISHEYDKKVCQQFGSNSKPRKNPLIAQWEKKIIKDNPN